MMMMVFWFKVVAILKFNNFTSSLWEYPMETAVWPQDSCGRGLKPRLCCLVRGDLEKPFTNHFFFIRMMESVSLPFYLVSGSLVVKSCPALATPPGSSVHQGKNTGVGDILPFPGDLPDPRIEPASPALADRFMAEPPGKPLLANMEAIHAKSTVEVLEYSNCSKSIYLPVFILPV